MLAMPGAGDHKANSEADEPNNSFTPVEYDEAMRYMHEISLCKEPVSALQVLRHLLQMLDKEGNLLPREAGRVERPAKFIPQVLVANRATEAPIRIVDECYNLGNVVIERGEGYLAVYEPVRRKRKKRIDRPADLDGAQP